MDNLIIEDAINGAVAHFQAQGMRGVALIRPEPAAPQIPMSIGSRPRPRRGRRLMKRAMHSRREWQIIIARWPRCDLIEARVPRLMCVFRGDADVQVDDTLLHCREGSFVFLPPGAAHPGGDEPHLDGAARENGSCDLLWFSPRGNGLQCWICHSHGAHHSGSKYGEKIYIYEERLLQLLEAIHEETLTPTSMSNEICQSALSLFLLTIQRNVRTKRYLMLDTPIVESPLPKTSTDPIAQARRYIEAHLNEPLTLTSVAHQVYMSRTQFALRFHQESGQTFNDFVNQCRLEHAQALLRETDWPVALICVQVGFKSASYFHQFFLARMGTSPAQFRRAQRIGRNNTWANDNAA
jgi:AraC-like DNA-binding protein